MVRRAAASWTWEPNQPAAPWYRDAAGALRNFDVLVNSHLAALREKRDELAQWLPTGVTPGETLNALEQAFREATDAGLLPGGDIRQTFPARLAAMGNCDWRTVEQLRRDLDRIQAADDDQWRPESIAAAARDRADLPQLVEFLRYCDEWLTSGLAEAGMRAGGTGQDLAEQVQQVSAEWEQVVAGVASEGKSHE